MQMLYAALQQIIAQFGRQRRSKKIGRAVAAGVCKSVTHNLRDRRTTALRKTLHPVPILYGQNPGHDRRGDASLYAGIAKPEERVRLKEELRDGRCRARINLALEKIDIGLLACGLGVLFGVGADTDIELAGLGKPRNKIDRRGKTFGVCLISTAALGRITAQCNNVGHTSSGITFGNRKRFCFCCIDTGQMRCHAQASAAMDCSHRLMGNFASRAASTVSHGDKCRFQRRQGPHTIPKPKGTFDGLGREEFE